MSKKAVIMKRTRCIILVVLFESMCTSVQSIKPYRFILPEIPSCIVDQDAKLSYLGAHFWDNYDFSNRAFICSEEGHRIYADYIALLLKMPEYESTEYIGTLMERARAESTTCMELFAGAEQLLYDPNSPLRNETLYMRVLEKMLLWKRLDETIKSRLQFQYLLACRNRPGQVATDFTYTLESGKEGKLKDIRSEYVLLYFNNSGCEDCKRVKKLLESSKVINELIGKGRLKVLSVYPDEDLGEWKKTAGTMPESWIVSYDKGAMIKKGNLYDLRAIPTLYLLDREKKVILKDSSIEETERYLFLLCR